MTNEELNTALYQKMFDEQEAYRSELLSMSPEQILEHAYAYTVREDILLSMEYHNLEDNQAKALLKSKHPLEDIFSKWENHETGYMEEIRDMIESHANSLIKEAKAKAGRDAR